VSWFEHADPLQVTAWATAVLAFVGLVSIMANSVLAWQARASAKASRDGVNLQAEELETVKRQLTLAEKQFAAAQDAARPRLRSSVVRAGSLYIEGTVSYVHGSEPAYEIRIWIRGPSRPGAAWGLFTTRIGFMTASDRELPFMAAAASAQEQAACPFPEFLNAEIAMREYLVGLTWERLDGSTDRLAEKQTLSLAEPPGITG
jgi:hypothetical protein